MTEGETPDADRIPRELQSEIEARLHTWKRFYLVWTTVHYAVNFLAIAATSLGGILPTVLDYSEHKLTYAVLAIAAVLFVFLAAFTSPSKQARMYMAAWRDLDLAYLAWMADSQKVAEVLGALKTGEGFLSGKDPF